MLRTLAHLWPYIWPANRRDLKNRVILATVLLFVAKLATVGGHIAPGRRHWSLEISHRNPGLDRPRGPPPLVFCVI